MLYSNRITMKQFTLILITKEPRMIERVESDNLIHLLSQFQFVLVNLVEKLELDKKMKEIKDDIPF